MTDFLLPIKDFERIYRIIHSVMNVINIPPHKACLFFNIIGSEILRRQYNLQANPNCGRAIFRLNDDYILVFGEKKDGRLVCTEESFHCWTEAEGWVIDFLSPLYKECYRASGQTGNIETKMFQKKSEESKNSSVEIVSEGDFTILEDTEIVKSQSERFWRTPLYSDLTNICLKWYQKPPLPIKSTKFTRDEKGDITKIKLHYASIREAW